MPVPIGSTSESGGVARVNRAEVIVMVVSLSP